MRIAAIAAMSENRVIGLHNRLPWHLPADLKHFKALTWGKPILMGRKTFASIGKPLPGRTNIIMTRDHSFTAAECVIVHSFKEALAAAQKSDAEELFIIGGADIYQQTLPHIDRLYLTLVHHPFTGDAFFPELDSQQWEEKEKITHAADATNPYAYSFIILEKRQ